MLHRRTLLGLGLTGAALLAAGSWQLLRQPSPWQAQQFSPDARSLMTALAAPLLDGLFATPEDLQAAMPSHLRHLQQAVAGLAPQTQMEVGRLLTILLSAPGRVALAGLGQPWTQASPQQVALALQDMRRSRWALRRQAYQALRDLHLAAWAAEASNWRHLGYPGPKPLG